MLKTRENIQKEAFTVIKNHNFKGTIVLGTGIGKTKVAIDCIKGGEFKNILITSPRTNLKNNWKKELEKWGITQGSLIIEERLWYNTETKQLIDITIENIQTCYKWPKTIFSQFDLIIFDEIHTMVTNKYSSVLEYAFQLGIPRIGLTATPDYHVESKQYIYNNYCPIVYTYLDGAKDKIINDRFYIIYKYELTNAIKTTITYSKGSFEKGELDHYNYLEARFKDVVTKMAEELDIDVENFKDHFYFAKSFITSGDRGRVSLGYEYLKIVRLRKDFLNTLWSSRYITEQLVSYILRTNKDSKILVFSELVAQLKAMGDTSVHSHNKTSVNTDLIEKFNNNEIRVLLSAQCLTLGLNLFQANYSIHESYNGSITQANQKLGRNDRLDVDNSAIVIILVPINTQKEKWYEKAFGNKIKEENSVQVSGLEEFFKAHEGYVNRRS